MSKNAVRSDKLKMSLDKSRIPKLSDSSRKFMSKKQRKSMIDPLVERIARTQTTKMENVLGGMVETRKQKFLRRLKGNVRSRDLTGPALDENRAGRGTERNENRRLVIESTA